MVKVIGVKFKTSGRVYYFDPLDLDIHAGDGVIVETARGLEFGEVAIAPKEVEEREIIAPLKPVTRIATDEDRRMRAQYAAKEDEAFQICAEKIAAHGLDMKLVDVEYTFNGSKVVFYFTADERVDFRELVKDLAYSLKTRIELRQIGVRDEAKMLGGIGPCGRLVCCKAFLDDFRPVSIKMAKEQNLSLSPTKISGLCGRLMCCLQYEQSAYEAIRSRMPKPGKEVNTIDGVGVVVENNAITERTKVRLTMDDGSIDVREYPYTHLSSPGEPLPAAALESRKTEADAEKDANAQFRKEAASNSRRGARPGTKTQNAQKQQDNPQNAQKQQDKSQNAQKQDKPNPQPKQSNAGQKQDNGNPPTAQQKPTEKTERAPDAGNPKPEQKKENNRRRRSKRRKPNNTASAAEKNN